MSTFCQSQKLKFKKYLPNNLRVLMSLSEDDFADDFSDDDIGGKRDDRGRGGDDDFEFENSYTESPAQRRDGDNTEQKNSTHLVNQPFDEAVDLSDEDSLGTSVDTIDPQHSPKQEVGALWIEQNNVQTSIVGNMFEEINLSRIFSISDQESQSLPSKALTKPRALELLSCFWNESERKKALASLLWLLPSLPNSFRYSAVLTYLFAKYRKDMRTKIEKRVDKYNTHVKMNKYLDYLYKTYKIDAKDIKIATTIMNVQQDTQTKNYLYHKPRHHNIELFRSLWLRRPTKKSSGLVVNGTAVIDTSQGNNGCWQCHNCICITCGSGSHGTDSCDQHHEDALIVASHDRDNMVMCPKCRVVSKGLQRKLFCLSFMLLTIFSIFSKLPYYTFLSLLLFIV